MHPARSPALQCQGRKMRRPDARQRPRARADARALAVVIPTPRLLSLLLVGAALFAAASFSPLLTVPAVAFTAVVAGVAALDALRSPRPRALAVERAVADRLSLGADNAVTLHVQNRSRYDLHLLVRDEAPQDFQLLAVQDASPNAGGRREAEDGSGAPSSVFRPPPSALAPPAPVGHVDVRG